MIRERLITRICTLIKDDIGREGSPLTGNQCFNVFQDSEMESRGSGKKVRKINKEQANVSLKLKECEVRFCVTRGLRGGGYECIKC